MTYYLYGDTFNKRVPSNGQATFTTERTKFSGEAKKAGRKSLGGAARGAGIGGIIDGGEGAGKGAGVGAVVGLAAAAKAPGNQIAVAPGTAVELRLARPLSVDIVA